MFWERLYQQCLQKSCKPNTVAKAIGLSSAIATKWKNGSIPNGEALIKIADYLDCSVDYLLGREIKKEGSTPLADMPQDALKLAQMYSELDDENKNKAMNFMTSLHAIDEYAKEVEYVGSYAAYSGEHGTIPLNKNELKTTK